MCVSGFLGALGRDCPGCSPDSGAPALTQVPQELLPSLPFLAVLTPTFRGFVES